MEDNDGKRGESSQRLDTDSTSDSDSSVDLGPRRRCARYVSESDSSSDDSDVVVQKRKVPQVIWSESDDSDSSVSIRKPTIVEESSDSDGQSDKCPICLLSFKKQEVASPEQCEHCFCVECIQEWSKNVNTCPVDRKPFSFIVVKSGLDGKVLRRVPIESVQELVVEDAVELNTCCEVCRAGDRPDRMLLCDGCDLGYHLECLNPPLEVVPHGAWFCPVCISVNNEVETARAQARPQNNNRIIPRTRQSERVRTRVMTRRTQNQRRANVFEEEIQVVINQISQGVGTRRRRKKRKPNIKITYRIDEATGIKIETRTRRRKYKRRKRKKRVKIEKTRTPRERLADQLGICAPRLPAQTIPEMRNVSENVSFQRAPGTSFSIYGGRNDLNYFSDSDDGEQGSGTLLVSRRPTASDAAVLRRTLNRKSVLLPSASSVSTSCDVLGGILESQSKFLSKSSKLIVGENGSIKIKNNNNIDLNNLNNSKVRKAPTGDSTANSVTTSTTSVSTTRSNEVVETYESNTVGHDSGQSNEGSSGSGHSDRSTHSNQPTCSSDLKDEKKNEEETELDIYGDIETVTTTKSTEREKSPPPALHVQSDDEVNNSDVDLVIDTENNERDEKAEEVTSTTSALDTKLARLKKDEDDDDDKDDKDDEDSEDGCPNFSIYSTESINLARNTELQLHEAQIGSSKRNDLKKVCTLYSDSDEENDRIKPFEFGDIRNMTEDISEDEEEEEEEERSYTPCLDENGPPREGLEGLDTEAISEDERNEFDESHEFKTVSDGDALEINAKESELDFTKPEDYEEGEIVDKKKAAEAEAETVAAPTPPNPPLVPKDDEKNEEEKDDEDVPKETFRKISKSNKERNYRDKEDRRRSRSKEKNKENERGSGGKKRKEKRKEIERYNVRSVVAENPRHLKDEFGRDARRRSSSSSSGSFPSSSPPPPPAQRRRSRSRDRKRRTKSRSRNRERTRSPRRRKESRSRTHRERSRSKVRRKPTREVVPRRKNRSHSRNRSRSYSPKRRKDWERRWSRSPSTKTPERQMSPSWTPPRLIENPPVQPHNLTVILTNDKKRKEKRNKPEKRKKEVTQVVEKKKRRREKTPPPSKEVFASGDNILVSVSFNKENDGENAASRETTIKRKRDLSNKRTGKKEKEKKKSPKPKKKKIHDLSGVKPVAIIDLARSPFKELTPSPKDVIVLTDDEENETNRQNVACDSSQQTDYPTGPKTPPEPQVKFPLNAKPIPLRAIVNPLHENDDPDVDIDPEAELDQRLNESMYKGPNTPPEPPNSPPSSPDVYDPFDPTKSRSPTPDANVQSSVVQPTETITIDDKTEDKPESQTDVSEDIFKSHTPPTDVQPDSQSNNPPEAKTPEKSSVSPTAAKVQQNPLVTSTPVTSTPARINILSSTILSTTTVISLPNRSTAPNVSKTPVKSGKKNAGSNVKPKTRKSDGELGGAEIDSPYSPEPSDYEDLFEPPTDAEKSATKTKTKGKGNAGGNKIQNTFDNLFGSSPVNKFAGPKKSYERKKKTTTATTPGKGTKMVGVKIAEDSLKILDDVPNSAVEMQVKDKFLKKLNRQERVVEEVKLVLKPHYNKKHINKEEYKDILRRAVPKICHNKSGEINPKKIQNLIEAYVKKIRHSKKVTSSSSVHQAK